MAPNSKPAQAPRRATLFALIAWAALGLGLLFVYRNFTVDDAFIGWRHGRNLVLNGVYAFNSTGERVDAATSFSFGMLAALPTIIGVDVVLFFKLFALVVMVAFAIFVVTQMDGMNRWLVVLVALAGPLQAVHMWSGLETGSYVLLGAVLALVALGCAQIPPWVMGALGTMLVLTRFEGAFIICALVWIQYVGPARKLGAARIARALAQAAIVWGPPLLAVILLSVWRWSYFGSPIPNTLATKTGQSGFNVGPAVSNLWAFMPLILAMFAPLLLMAKRDRVRYATLCAWTTPVFILYLSSSLLTNYAHRFPFQAAWPTLVAGAALIRGELLLRVVYAAAFSFAPVTCLSLGSLTWLVDYYPRLTASHAALGEALKDMGRPGVLVMGDAGLAPFVSDWYVLDTIFLGTPASFGEGGIEARIRESRRTVLSLYADGAGYDELRLSQEDYRDAALANGYERVCSAQWRASYWLEQWVSPDVSTAEKALITGACTSSTQANSAMRLRQAVFGWYWHS